MLKLTGDSPHPSRVSGWVEDELAETVQRHGFSMGMKTSPTVRRLLILGLIADGVEIQSEVEPVTTATAITVPKGITA